MYKNYGDKNFFEYGRLVEQINDHEFEVLVCEGAQPYEDDVRIEVFPYAHCTVNINDNWIDKEKIFSFNGMTEDTFNPILYALDCIQYYGVENFGGHYDYPDRVGVEQTLNWLYQNKRLDISNMYTDWLKGGDVNED